jgi:CPA2 family monovalent cation:H+ antiporter-2
VLLEEAFKSSLVPPFLYQLILTSAVVTMILTPFLSRIPRRLAQGRFASLLLRFGRGASIRELDRASEIMHDHVLICGFGVTGRSIASVLKANNLSYAILELNARMVREERKKGEPIFFGDCTDPDILFHANLARARVAVIAISDPFATRLAVKSARDLNPELVILARNKYLAEIDTLLNLGANEVISEEFETSIELLARTLRLYNFPRQLVAQEIKSIRDGRYRIFRDRHPTVPRLRLSSQLDIYTETFEIESESVMSGRRIDETQLRQKSGALILGIIREGEKLIDLSPSTTIQAGDLLVLCGTKGQLKKAVKLLSTTGDLK